MRLVQKMFYRTQGVMALIGNITYTYLLFKLAAGCSKTMIMMYFLLHVCWGGYFWRAL